MKLLSIALTDYRGVESSKVELRAPGVTVVVGPNEIGKSSLAEALGLIRDYKDSSKRQEIKDVKPTHRDVGPQVAIEVETGPYRFVYTKRWLKKPETTLHVTAPRDEQLTGEQAHERVERIFAETLDDELWHALRQTQGESLAQPVLAKIAPLQAALSDAVSEDGHDPTGQNRPGGAHGDLMARVQAEHDLYFTRANGSPTKELARAGSLVDELEGQVAELVRALREVEAVVERHARLTAERAALDERARHSAEVLKELEASDAVLAGLRREHEQAEARRRDAEHALAATRSALEARRLLVAEDAERHTEIVEAERVRAEAETLNAEAVAALEGLVEGHEVADAALDAAETAVVELRSTVTSARAAAELAALAERLRRIDAATATLEQAEVELGTRTVTAAVLREAAEAEVAVRTAHALAAAGAARVTVERLGDVAVTLDSGSVEETLQVDVTGVTVVEAAGVMRVTVEPDEAAGRRGHDVARAEKALAALLAPHGAATLEALQQAAEAREAVVRRRDGALTERAAFLAGDDVAALRARSATLTSDAPSPLPGDPPSVGVDELEQRLHAAEGMLQDAVREAGRVRDLIAAAQQRVNGRQHALVRATVAAEAAATEALRVAARLESERAAASDEALAHAALEAEAEAAAAALAVASARAALEESDATSVELRLSNARTALERLAEDRRANEHARITAETELEVRGRDGLQDQLDHATALLEDARRDLARRQARADAVHLLLTTLTRHQRAAEQRYVAPFREAVERLGSTVFGAGFGVEISDDLAIVARTLDGIRVPFESLSGGAKEQLAVIGRLATARLVSQDLGAPVILDDSLGFTDGVRRERLAAVINRVGEAAQIIILTCEPERFSRIGSATTVTLG